MYHVQLHSLVFWGCLTSQPFIPFSKEEAICMVSQDIKVTMVDMVYLLTILGTIFETIMHTTVMAYAKKFLVSCIC